MMNRLPLDVDLAGVLWVRVSDADDEAVTDLAYDDTRLGGDGSGTGGTVSISKFTGNTATAGPTSVTLTSGGVHDLITTHAAAGIYGVEIPASGGTVNCDAVGVYTLTMLFTNLPDAYSSTFVIDPDDALGAEISANVVKWLGTAPNALVSGRVDASAGALAAGVVTAASIDSNAITDAKINDEAFTAAKFAADALTAFANAEYEDLEIVVDVGAGTVTVTRDGSPVATLPATFAERNAIATLGDV